METCAYLNHYYESFVMHFCLIVFQYHKLESLFPLRVLLYLTMDKVFNHVLV